MMVPEFVVDEKLGITQFTQPNNQMLVIDIITRTVYNEKATLADCKMKKLILPWSCALLCATLVLGHFNKSVGD
jgi:hypothetical protein